MFSQKIATKFTEKSYFEKIKKASELLENADNIIIGVGAGLTASGGINYLDTEHFKQLERTDGDSFVCFFKARYACKAYGEKQRESESSGRTFEG